MRTAYISTEIVRAHLRLTEFMSNQEKWAPKCTENQLNINLTQKGIRPDMRDSCLRGLCLFKFKDASWMRRCRRFYWSDSFPSVTEPTYLPLYYSYSSRKIIHEHSREDLDRGRRRGAITTPRKIPKRIRLANLRDPICYVRPDVWHAGRALFALDFTNDIFRSPLGPARAVTHRLLIRTEEIERSNSGALLAQKTFVGLSFPRHKVYKFNLFVSRGRRSFEPRNYTYNFTCFSDVFVRLKYSSLVKYCDRNKPSPRCSLRSPRNWST